MRIAGTALCLLAAARFAQAQKHGVPYAQSDEPRFQGKYAHVYFDEKHLTWRIGNDTIERVIHFARDEGSLRTREVTTKDGLPHVTVVTPNEGEFTVDGVGRVALDHDWAYSWQSVQEPAEGGRKLTIHLEGIRSHHGYEVEAMYQVQAGNRPYLAKSLTFINLTAGPLTVSRVVEDRWVLAAEPVKAKAAPAAPIHSASAKSDFLLMARSDDGFGAFMVTPLADIGANDGAVAVRANGPVVAAPDGGRAYMPQSVVYPFKGSEALGLALRKQYGESPRTASK